MKAKKDSHVLRVGETDVPSHAWPDNASDLSTFDRVRTAFVAAVHADDKGPSALVSEFEWFGDIRRNI